MRQWRRSQTAERAKHSHRKDAAVHDTLRKEKGARGCGHIHKVTAWPVRLLMPLELAWHCYEPRPCLPLLLLSWLCLNFATIPASFPIVLSSLTPPRTLFTFPSAYSRISRHLLESHRVSLLPLLLPSSLEDSLHLPSSCRRASSVLKRTRLVPSRCPPTATGALRPSDRSKTLTLVDLKSACPSR